MFLYYAILQSTFAKIQFQRIFNKFEFLEETQIAERKVCEEILALFQPATKEKAANLIKTLAQNVKYFQVESLN